METRIDLEKLSPTKRLRVVPIIFSPLLSLLLLDTGIGDWPTVPIAYDIQNSSYKIYGGAQYERLLNEFEYIAHSKEFPHTSINEVAAAIGTSKFHNVPIYETAVRLSPSALSLWLTVVLCSLIS